MIEIERVARLIAATKMGLIKDPEGLKLPDSLWRQAIPQAERSLREDRLVGMLKTCIAELRALDAHTIPTQAENLLTELGY